MFTFGFGGSPSGGSPNPYSTQLNFSSLDGIYDGATRIRDEVNRWADLGCSVGIKQACGAPGANEEGYVPLGITYEPTPGGAQTTPQPTPDPANMGAGNLGWFWILLAFVAIAFLMTRK